MTASDELAMCFICFRTPSDYFGVYVIFFFGIWAEEMNLTNRSEHFKFVYIVFGFASLDPLRFDSTIFVFTLAFLLGRYGFGLTLDVFTLNLLTSNTVPRNGFFFFFF